MFDFAWSELGLAALVAALILGPKQLPQAMRAMAKAVRRVRGLASEFQGHFNDMIREAELEDVRKSVQKLSSTNISAEVSKVIDPKGEIDNALREDPFKEKKEAADDTPALPETPEPEASTSTAQEPSAERPGGQTT